MASLELKNIIKDFGETRVIHGVDLQVNDGEFVVFVGPSGCGKSTLLRMICGLEQASSGDIHLDGVRVNNTKAADRGLAMVFQSYALYPHMSVYQNMAFGLENMGLAKKDVKAKVGEASKLLRLDSFLFDEPLSNLDAELRVSMRSEITGLHRRLGSTMIYVTHDQVEAMTMADKIVVLRLGKIEQVGTPLDLYNRPDNRFVAGFIGSPQMNFVPVTAGDNEQVSTAHGAGITLPCERKIAAGTALTLGVRPEHLSLVETPGALGLPIKVSEVEQLGGHCLIYGSLPDDGTRVTAQCEGQQPTRIGDTVMLYAEATTCHLFEADGQEKAIR